jgi:hypothetical protein
MISRMLCLPVCAFVVRLRTVIVSSVPTLCDDLLLYIRQYDHTPQIIKPFGWRNGTPKNSPREHVCRLDPVKKGSVRVTDFINEKNAPMAGTVSYWMWKLPMEGMLQDMPYKHQFSQLDILLPKANR